MEKYQQTSGVLLVCLALSLPLLAAGKTLINHHGVATESRQTCFTCVNAKSNEECNRNMATCEESQGSCQTEIRVFNTKTEFSIRIDKRCKQSLACANNVNQNDQPAWPLTQCNHLPDSPLSVCRFCCNTPGCNGEMQERSCTVLTAPTNGEMICSFNNDTMSEVCSFKCDDCYSNQGSSKRMCMDGNIWSGEVAVCQYDNRCDQCSEEMTLAPTDGGVVCTDGRQVGSKCSFFCDEDFELVGSSDVMCQGSNRKWDNIKPTCRESRAAPVVNCDVVSVVENGLASCLPDDHSEGSVCIFECDPCHKVNGSHVRTCQSDTQWSGTPTQCVYDPISDPLCPDALCDVTMLEAPENGVVECTDGARWGSTCSYFCDDGFRRKGRMNIKCDPETGEWEKRKPVCKFVVCDDLPAPTNGSKECDTEQMLQRTECTFDCDVCFTLIGSKFRSCYGTWSGTEATCQYDPINDPNCPAAFCYLGTAQPILNGETNCTNGARLGSTCSFKCDPGFTLYGADEVHCDVTTGVWDDVRIPICQRACHELAVPSTDGTKCECRRGFEGDGYNRCSEVNECSAANECHEKASCTNTDGSYRCDCIAGYTGDGLSCVDVDECLVGTHNCDVINGICVNEPGTFYCTCAAGYQGDGITCTKTEDGCRGNELDGGKYCYTLVNPDHVSFTASDACMNVNVGHPAIIRTRKAYEVLNAKLLSELIPTGDVTTKILGPYIGLSDRYQPGVYRWRDGAPLSGTDFQVWPDTVDRLIAGTARCVHLVSDPLRFGTRDFKWVQYRCSEFARYVCNTEKTYEQLTLCQPALSAIPNGQVACSDGWNKDSSCVFACDPGFHLVGSTDTLVCKEPLLGWDNIIPICAESVCPAAFGAPNGGSVTCSDHNRVGSECKFECKEGYVMSGPSDVTCMDNMKWSGKKPCCIDECPPKAHMDLIYVLDSSSSIGAENFEKMKDFVEGIHDGLYISSSFTRVTFISFHSAIDTPRHNNTWFNSKQQLNLAIDAVQFAGKGTRAGLALQYVRENLLGQRHGATTVVIILTDGNAKDNAKLESSKLRKEGAHVMVVGITGSMVRDLEVLASKPAEDNVFSLLDTTQVLPTIGERVCNIQC